MYIIILLCKEIVIENDDSLFNGAPEVVLYKTQMNREMNNANTFDIHVNDLYERELVLITQLHRFIDLKRRDEHHRLTLALSLKQIKHVFKPII